MKYFHILYENFHKIYEHISYNLWKQFTESMKIFHRVYEIVSYILWKYFIESMNIFLRFYETFT